MVLDMSDLGRQAQRLLENARAQANQIIEDAKLKAQSLVDGADERGHARGFERGLIEGREQGKREAYEQALAQWLQQLEQVSASITAAIQDWEQRRDQVMHQATEDVIAFAIEVARRVTHRVIHSDPTVVREQVAAALKLVSRPTAIEIVVHPDQRQLLDKLLPQLIESIASCKHASIREDGTMLAGGCVINTAGGRVDASIETQLTRIAELLMPEVAVNTAMTEHPPDSSLSS